MGSLKDRVLRDVRRTVEIAILRSTFLGSDHAHSGWYDAATDRLVLAVALHDGAVRIALFSGTTVGAAYLDLQKLARDTKRPPTSDPALRS